MIKKFLLGFIIIFLCVFSFVNIANAASKNTSAKKEVYPHWQKNPINVYIPQDQYSGSMRSAFAKWQGASGGKLNFKYVAKEKADIVVTFTDKNEGLESTLGGYSTTIDGTTIKKATITIASKSKEAKKHSPSYIYTTMLHEVGHVIGMSHNPSKPSSIMYSPISEKQNITKVDLIKLYKVNGWNLAKRNFNN